MSTWLLDRHHGYLEGVGGLRLHYRTWEPGEPTAAMLLVHGLGEHGGCYARLAERLAEHGFVTFAPDLRGHGRSDGRRGHVSRFEIYLQDLDRFRREAQGLLDPGLPFFLLGHGLGGLVVLRYLEEFGAPVSGAILSSPWVAGSSPFPRSRTALARLLERVLPAVRLATRLDPGLATRDPEPGAVCDDPLSHDAFTPRLLREVSAAMDQALQRRVRPAAPLLVMLGAEDRVTASQRTAALLRSLPGASLQTRRYEGRGHDVLGGAGADEVLDDLVGWLEERLEAAAVESAAGAATGPASDGPHRQFGTGLRGSPPSHERSSTGP